MQYIFQRATLERCIAKEKHGKERFLRSFLFWYKKEPKKIKAEKPDPMGAPWVELPRDTIRHAAGVAHVVSLTRPTATFHPRPILGSGFYATAYVTRCCLRNCIKEELRILRDASPSSAWQGSRKEDRVFVIPSKAERSLQGIEEKRAMRCFGEVYPDKSGLSTTT